MKFYKIDEERDKYYEDDLLYQHTTKGVESLFYQKYKYSLKGKTSDGVKNFRCIIKACTATLVVSVNGEVLSNKKHIHAECVVGQYLKYFIMNNIKYFSLKSFLSPKEIVSSIIVDLDTSEKKHMACNSSLFKRINKLRRNNSLIICNEDEEIPLEYYKTLDNL
ncbi:hypothetical protein DMUE_4208 [Dictyocoela muelleri]|nr:hypothetical protein DMUE_4208 [Dictyocoela muelleri]